MSLASDGTDSRSPTCQQFENQHDIHDQNWASYLCSRVQIQCLFILIRREFIGRSQSGLSNSCIPVDRIPRTHITVGGRRDEIRIVWRERAAVFFKTFGKKPLLWVSNNNRHTYDKFKKFFEALKIKDEIKRIVDYKKGIVLYCGFFVIGNRSYGESWHVDYQPGANAYTLLVPLFQPDTNHGNLLYRDQYGNSQTYVYKPGEGIVFGDHFLHTTEPYLKTDVPRALLSLTIGTDKLEYWDVLKQTIGSQSEFMILPCGHEMGSCQCLEKPSAGRKTGKTHKIGKEELKWARGHVECKRPKVVADRPWSRTYMLTASDGSRTYLKVVPAGRADEVRVTPILAHHFPDSVPGVVAHDADRGFLLIHDHGGTRLSLRSVGHAHQLISSYAAMQARARSTPGLLSALPAYDVSLALEDLLFCLCPDRRGSSRGLPLATPAEAFIGPLEAARYWDALTQRSTLILDQLARAEALPTTLAHGDLHADNAAMTPDGRCVLYDWGEAAAGPAGLSLCNPLLLKGIVRTTRVVMGMGKAKGDDDGGYDLGRMSCSFDVLADIIGWDEIIRGLISAYVDRLVEGGYASRHTILEGLPGSLLAGAIRWMVCWCMVAGYDKSLSNVAGAWLRSGLDDILELHGLLERDCVAGDAHDETTNRLYSQNPDVTVRKEGDEVLLIDAEGGVCRLNETADALWRLLGEPTSLRQAAADLQTAFPEAPRKQIESDTLASIAGFVEDGLVTWRGCQSV